MRLLPLPPRFAAVAAFTLAASSAAWAQSLQELYDAARAYDAPYLAAKALAASAEHRVAQSEALLKPTASLSASATATKADVPRAGTGDSNAIGTTLSGRYPLFNRANAATVEKARKGLVTARADLETAEQDLIVRVAQAYFDVLAAKDTLTTTQANKKAITEQLASAKRNFEVGTQTITDTREAQARFDLATAQEIGAENDLRTKRIVLDQLVGRTGVEPRPLAVPVVLPPLMPQAVEEWVSTAEARHPGIERARIGLETALLDTRIARAGQLPTVDAIASLGATRNGGSAGSARPGVTKTGTVGVQMSWTLDTGGSIQSRIQETLVLEEKARNDLEAARRSVALGTRSAFFGVQSLTAQVKAFEAAESSNTLALEAAQLAYRVGVRVNLDVLNAQTQLFQTQRDLARARYDVLVNGLKLRQASGQLAPAHVDAVNRLLAK